MKNNWTNDVKYRVIETERDIYIRMGQDTNYETAFTSEHSPLPELPNWERGDTMGGIDIVRRNI